VEGKGIGGLRRGLGKEMPGKTVGGENSGGSSSKKNADRELGRNRNVRRRERRRQVRLKDNRPGVVLLRFYQKRVGPGEEICRGEGKEKEGEKAKASVSVSGARSWNGRTERVKLRAFRRA